MYSWLWVVKNARSEALLLLLCINHNGANMQKWVSHWSIGTKEQCSSIHWNTLFVRGLSSCHYTTLNDITSRSHSESVQRVTDGETYKHSHSGFEKYNKSVDSITFIVGKSFALCCFCSVLALVWFQRAEATVKIILHL